MVLEYFRTNREIDTVKFELLSVSYTKSSNINHNARQDVSQVHLALTSRMQ